MSCGRPTRSSAPLASACKSPMASRGCTRCGGSLAVGEGAGEGGGGRGWRVAAAGEEACSEESRGGRGPHWAKETSCSLYSVSEK